jgi:hypothetical protein
MNIFFPTEVNRPVHIFICCLGGLAAVYAFLAGHYEEEIALTICGIVLVIAVVISVFV